MPALQTLTVVFWLESIAYLVCLMALGAVVLLIVALRRRPHWPLLFWSATGIFWAFAALLLRITTWLQVGRMDLWLEFSTLGAFFMGPAYLIFAIDYVGEKRAWPKVLARTLFLINVAVSLPLLQHRLIYAPYFEPSGMLNYRLHPFALATTIIPVTAYGAVLYLLRQAASKPEERYLQWSAVLWLVGFIPGGALRPYLPVPTMSVLITVSVMVFSYGLVRSQVFNPLRDRTLELEQQLMLAQQEMTRTQAELEARQRSLARQRTLLETVIGILHTVAAVPGQERQMAAAVRTIAVRLGLYHVGLFWLDATGKALRLKAASSDYGQSLAARGYTYPLAEAGLLGLAVRHGEPQLSLMEDADTLNADWTDTRSRVAIPLRVGDKVIGVLDLHSKQRGAFSTTDLLIFQVLADQLALWLANTQLTEEAAARVEAERRAYGEVTAREWQGWLSSRAITGYYSDAEGITPLTAEMELPKAEGLPELVLPLVLRGRTIGRLLAHKPDASATWTDEERALLQNLSEQLVGALESARLYETAQRQATRERLIGEVMGRIRASMDLQTVLKLAAQELQVALRAPELTVQLLSPLEEQQ